MNHPEKERPQLEVRLDLPAVATLLMAVRFTLQRWPGGEPVEQENLQVMRDSLFRMQLELTVGEEISEE